MDSMEPTQPDVATTRLAMRPPRPSQVIFFSNPNKRKSPSSAWDHFEKFIDVYIVARSTWLIEKFMGHLL